MCGCWFLTEEREGRSLLHNSTSIVLRKYQNQVIFEGKGSCVLFRCCLHSLNGNVVL